MATQTNYKSSEMNHIMKSLLFVMSSMLIDMGASFQSLAKPCMGRHGETRQNLENVVKPIILNGGLNWKAGRRGYRTTCLPMSVQKSPNRVDNIDNPNETKPVHEYLCSACGSTQHV